MQFILIAALLGFFTFINILAPLSGSATVTPLLAGLVGAKEAVAIATVFFFLTCIPRVLLFLKFIRWDIVKTLWPVSVAGALVGGLIFAGISEVVIALIILCFLLWFLYQKASVVFSKRPVQEKQPTKHGVAFVGLLSGALQGTGLAGSDLRNGYLLSKGLSISHIHGTTALIGGSNFLFANIVRVQSGELTWAMVAPILALFPLIIIATYAGRHVTMKLSKPWQDRLSLLVMIIALGILLFGLLEPLA
jgi:uncharacterized protein